MEKEELAMTTMEYVPSVIHELMNLVIVLVVYRYSAVDIRLISDDTKKIANFIKFGSIKRNPYV